MFSSEALPMQGRPCCGAREGGARDAACGKQCPLLSSAPRSWHPAPLPCASASLTSAALLSCPPSRSLPQCKQYTYSGATLQPAGWHPAVAQLKALAEAAADTTFNCCLLNRYRGGDDCIGWHSDNERLFGAAPTIGARGTALGRALAWAGGRRVHAPPHCPCGCASLRPRRRRCRACSLGVAGRPPRVPAAPQRRPRRQVQVTWLLIERRCCCCLHGQPSAAIRCRLADLSLSALPLPAPSPGSAWAAARC